MKRKQLLSAILALTMVLSSSSIASAAELNVLGSNEVAELTEISSMEEDENSNEVAEVDGEDKFAVNEMSDTETDETAADSLEADDDYDIRMIEEFAKYAEDLPEEDPVPSVEGQNCADEGLLNSSDVFVEGTSLPSSFTFDKSTMMPVRNQNPYGTCWTFATLACLEMSAVKQGFAKASDIDLSEHHLEFYTTNSVVDPLKGTKEDMNYFSGTNEQRAKMGGNMNLACNTLFTWQGCANEKDYPYKNILNNLPETIASAYASDSFHAAELRMMSIKDTNLIKQTVMKNGIVAISMRLEQSKYYNATNKCHYCPSTLTPNHAVAIVGWDDNYSKTNFSPAQPSSNGAWLIRNSWGDKWGDNGYFWLSYEDKTMGANVYDITVEPVNKYANNYQYDGGLYETYFSRDTRSDVVQEANVFTAKANPSGAEYLDAVSFQTYNVNCKYDVQIYLEPGKNPTSGVKAFTSPIAGVTTTVGRYQVVLPKRLYLKEGTKYAVVVTYYRNSDYLTIVREYGYRLSLSGGGQLVCQVGLDEGESYSSFNGVWSEETRGNYRVKAYTNNTAVDAAQEKALATMLEGEPIPFTDVAKNTWKYKPVQYVYKNKLMAGIKDVSGRVDFKPNDNISRSQVATILYNSVGRPATSYYGVFSDVPAGKYYSNPVIWAYRCGVISGKGDGTFDPNGNVTRQELAVMLYNYSLRILRESRGSKSITGFSDASAVSSWARNAMMWAVGNGVISGKSQGGALRLDPGGTATRAECAAMLMNMGLGE